MESLESHSDSEMLLEYRKNVRAKARQSLKELDNVLHLSPIKSQFSQYRRSALTTSSPLGFQARTTDYNYREAVGKLKTLMQDYSPEKSVHFNPKIIVHGSEMQGIYALPPEERISSLREPIKTLDKTSQSVSAASKENYFPLIQKQDDYINHLENSNTLLQSELSSLKLSLAEIVSENEKLHLKNKTSFAESLMEEINQNSPKQSGFQSDEEKQKMKSQNTNEEDEADKLKKTLQEELDRVQLLHSMKIEQLESQLKASKEELAKSEKEIVTLKEQNLNMSVDRYANILLPFCEKCGTEASSRSFNSTVFNLTKERDDLLERIVQLKAEISDLKERELDAHDQLRKSIELIEQSQLEKMQAEVKQNQMKENLQSQKQKIDDLLKESEEKLKKQKDLLEKKHTKKVDDLQNKLKTSLEDQTALQIQLERINRENSNLQSDLEQTRNQFQALQTELKKMTTDFKTQITQSSLEKNMVNNELNQIRTVIAKERKEHGQEKERLSADIQEQQRRILQMEKDLLSSKEECLMLTQSLLDLRKTLAIDRENAKRSKNEEILQLIKKTQQREEEMNQIVKSLEAKQTKTEEELEEIITSQNHLLCKLKEECKFLSERLVHLNDKYRDEVNSFRSEIEVLQVSLVKNHTNCLELENQCQQHWNLHQEMKKQLQQQNKQIEKLTEERLQQNQELALLRLKLSDDKPPFQSTTNWSSSM